MLEFYNILQVVPLGITITIESCPLRLCLLVLHEVASSDSVSVLFSMVLAICRF